MEKFIVNVDKEILGGTPVFFGTRVPVKNLFDYLETGETIETFLEDFEGVSREQVIRLLDMSQKLLETTSNIFLSVGVSPTENNEWRVKTPATKKTLSQCRRYTDT